MATQTRMTLEEYLHLPEMKPYKEFVDDAHVPDGVELAKQQWAAGRDNVAVLRTFSKRTVEIEAELEARGCKVAHRETLSADLSTGSSQIPLAVQQMRGKGVNAVMLLANPVYATQFVQGAQAQAGQRQPKGLWLSLSEALRRRFITCIRSP